MKWLAIIAAFVTIVAGLGCPQYVHAQQTANAGYDAQGRLICVRRTVSGTTRTTTYAYDAAGNRTTVSTVSGGTCASTLGTPPTAPPREFHGITVTSPTVTVQTGTQVTHTWSQLGSATDSSTLTLQHQGLSGTQSPCGTVSVTTSQVTYTAPTITHISQQRTCYFDYRLVHASGASEDGRLTYQVVMPPAPPPPPPGDDCLPGDTICIGGDL